MVPFSLILFNSADFSFYLKWMVVRCAVQVLELYSCMIVISVTEAALEIMLFVLLVVVYVLCVFVFYLLHCSEIEWYNIQQSSPSGIESGTL